MRRLLKGIAVALALGFAMPAFAQSNRVNDTAKQFIESGAVMGMGTDSGTHKAKRHAKKKVRNAQKKTRDTKNDAKDKMDKMDNK